MWVLRQRGPKATIDAGAHAWEAGVSDGSEVKLGGGTANLLKMRCEERLPRRDGGWCGVGARHGAVGEVGETGCGGTGCQSVKLVVCRIRAL
jgi:hypothetical protein